MEKNKSLVENYLKKNDWRLKENSNMSYSVQGLNNHIASSVTAQYWLNELYSDEIRKAHEECDLHIHDLGLLAPYCMGLDFMDLLMTGFNGNKTKVESKPPKRFTSVLGQLVNYMCTTQTESAGAQAVSSFDTYLAPFVRNDGLTYDDVKQGLQEFIFSMNVPTRIGSQPPFTNVTLDATANSHLKDEHVVIGGELQDETYGEYGEEIGMINKAFSEILLEGDGKGKPFAFPIPTVNITDDFDWNNKYLEKMWEATAKYGNYYFSNFVGSDMDPSDIKSMCCRLRLDLTEIKKRGGGLFGANPLTGSISVTTLNMSKLGYLSKDEDEYFERLDKLITMSIEISEEKRRILEMYTKEGLYPYIKFSLRNVYSRFGEYWKNHFSTIGINGMNESMLNFYGKGIDSRQGKEFSVKVLKHINKRMVEAQEKTGNMYNLEATPAEGCFIGSTIVRTEEGDRQIKDLVGKEFKVLSYSDKEARIVKRKAYNVRKTEKDAELYRITFSSGETLVCTKNHPFAVMPSLKEINSNKSLIKWVSAIELEPLDILKSISMMDREIDDYLDFDHNRIVRSVEKLDYKEDVYNMEVEDTECYFVGSNIGVLAHNCGFRFAKHDKATYPDIQVANNELVEKEGADPYYTSSTWLHVGYTKDVVEMLDHQDDLQTLYSSGTVAHLFIGERMQDGEAAKRLIKMVTSNYKLPYISISPTFSICPVHGYINGEHKYCPKCDAEIGFEED